MLYIISLFIPPLGVLLAGRIVTAVVLLVIWIVLVLISLILGHIIAVVLAWVLIGSAKGDKRHKQMMNAMSKDKD